MYLLDTNIVSELRKSKPHGAVVAWLQSVDDRDLFLSAVTIGEIQAGIELTRVQDDEKAQQLSTWLDQLANNYNVLPMTAITFRIWAIFMHAQSNTVIEDAMIAACASQHCLIVVTRNLRDFARFPVKLFNPFEYKSA